MKFKGRFERRDRWLASALAVLFASLTIALTWPLVTLLDEALPLGTERVATVPLFNLWTLAWNIEQLGRTGYWDAPIFHPTPAAFALSEPQPLVGSLAKALAVVLETPLAVYNVLLLLALTTNGWFAALGLRWLGLGWPAACGGGLLILLMPFTHQELGVLQLVPLAGIFAGFAGILHFASRPGILAGCSVGACWAIALGISFQTGLFGMLAAAPAALVLWWRHRTSSRAWAGLALGAVLLLLVLAPVLSAQRRAFADEAFERSATTQAKLSAQPDHYHTSAWPPLVSLPGLDVADHPGGRAFWPGILSLLLGIGAFALAWKHPQWRLLVGVTTLTLGCSLLWSHAGHWQGMLAELRTLPVLAGVRSWFRFALFVQLSVCGLAAFGLELVSRKLPRRLPRGLRVGIVIGLATLAAIDVRPAPVELQPLPPVELDLPWLTWIEENTHADDVLAFIPFPDGGSSAAYLGTTQWMYWQIRHWRPMVNGYSGFFPSEFRDLKKTMANFPASAALEALADRRVRYCIVHRSFADLPEQPQQIASEYRLRRVFRDRDHRLDILELVSPPASLRE